jgi:tetratricopeptide (TPR) repeat protein
MSLTAGEAAFEKGDWPAAHKNLQEYLSRNPDDVEILKKYAKARLSIRPVDPANVAGAIAAYRRVLQLAPLDDVAYEQLAMLYPAVGDYEDLAYIARMRLEHTPDDPNDRKAPNDWKAPLWLANALLRLNKAEEARQTLERLIGKLEPLPDKHVEYVKACATLCQIAAAADSADAKTKALEWLNKAVTYAPDSVEALASRARFYRQTKNIPGIGENDRMALARKDLDAADGLGTEDPEIRGFLCSEWMAHKEFDRAAAELKAADTLPQETLEKHFFDLDNWVVQRFLLASELARQRGAITEGVSLAEEALAALKEKRHRIKVLPAAIPFYVAAGKVSEARGCLKEYLDLDPLHAQEGTAESRVASLAYLQALVARAENNWYAVIDVLQPVVASNASQPQLWRLLAEAFSRTDQSRRAVTALKTYLGNDPGNPEMTLQLAKEYLRLRDWNKAQETARLAAPLEATDFTVRLLRIEASVYAAAEQQQKPTAATFSKLSEELTQLRADHPDQVDIRILQALIANTLEQPQEVERQLKLAIEECKEPLKAEMQLAGHYLATKRIPEAISVCETACQHHAGIAAPWLSLADLHAASSDYEAARKSLKQGLDALADPREKRSLSIKLALLELLQGDRTAGIDLLKGLADQDGQDIQARLLLLSTREVREDRTTAEKLIGELKQAEGQSGLQWRLQEASLWLSPDDWRSKQQDITDRLQYCIDADPAWTTPVLLLAGMYEKLGDVRRVEDVYRQALARNPSAADIADRLLTLLEKHGRFADAEKVLQQIQANPRLASAWHVRMALGTGDLSRAIDELKLRVSSDSQDANSRIQLARVIYQQTKDSGQALRYLKEAEAITPNSPALAVVKAMILRTEGQTEEARRVLDDYVENRKDFAAYQMRAAYLANEGQWERAEEDYRKLTTFAENGTTGYQLLSNFYAGRKNLDKAVATLEEGLNAHPADPSLERGLMRLLLQRAQGQDRERGIGILGSLEKRLPQDPELMKLRVMLLLESPTLESIGTARATLKNVIKLEPTAVDAHLALIGLAMQASEYQAARDYTILALGSNSNNRALQSARARAELALENTPMAVELAHLVLQEDPNNTEAIDVLVEAGLRSNNRNLLDEVRTQIESAVHRAPTNERLLLSRARILTALELSKAAIPELETYCQTKQGSSSVAALVTLADLYRLTGNTDRSKQWIDQAERLDSSSQAVIHARLLWLVSQNRFEELKGISSAYLSAKGQNPTILLRAASILAASNSMDLKKEGLKLFEHAATLSPTSVDIRLGLASTLYQTGDAERAEKIYREVLGQHPDNVQALNDLAWILQEHYQRYEAALELANKGLGLAPDDTHLLDTRGTILSNISDRLPDARKDFERLVQLLPSDTRQQAKALLQLGRICAKLNDLAQAKQHLQKALEIDRKLNIFTEDERSEITKILQQSEK